MKTLPEGNENMSGGAFCIICGNSSPLSSDRFCEQCFRKRTELSKFPDRIQQNRCAKCNSFELKGRWSSLTDEEVVELRIKENLLFDERCVKSEVDYSFKIIDERTHRINVNTSGTIEGLEFSNIHDSLLQTSNAVCNSCARRAGSYFEATVQLRSAGRKLNSDELADLRGTLDKIMESDDPNPMYFVTKEGPVTGGWDLQLGSKSLARIWGRNLVKKFGGTVKESSTIVGVNDGIDVTRLTLSYRKPAYTIGDVVRFRKENWLIDSWQKEGPIIRRINRFEKSGVTWRDMESCNLICSFKEQKEVDILSRDSSAAEFMDPLDYRIQTVALPYGDDGKQKSLRIGFIEGEWLALPINQWNK